jgi:hypothetical protein
VVGVKLDVEPVAKGLHESPEVLGGLVDVAELTKRLDHRTAQTGSRAHHPLVEASERVPVDPRLLVLAVVVPLGRHGPDVVEPGVVHGPEDEVVVVADTSDLISLADPVLLQDLLDDLLGLGHLLRLGPLGGERFGLGLGDDLRRVLEPELIGDADDHLRRR